MELKLGRLTVRAGAALMAAAVFVLGGAELAAAVFIAAAAHEAGHLAALRLTGARLVGIEAGFGGARIRYRGRIGLRRQAAVAAAGPAAGALLALPLARLGGAFACTVAGVSAALSVYNLLPVSVTDGGVILRCLAEAAGLAAERVSAAADAVLCGGLVLAGTLVLFTTGGGLTLILFGVVLWTESCKIRAHGVIC